MSLVLVDGPHNQATISYSPTLRRVQLATREIDTNVVYLTMEQATRLRDFLTAAIDGTELPTTEYRISDDGYAWYIVRIATGERVEVAGVNPSGYHTRAEAEVAISTLTAAGML